jgi:hypothetical protein
VKGGWGETFEGAWSEVRSRRADNEGMPVGTNVLRWDSLPERREGAAEAPRRGSANDAEIVLPGRGLKYDGSIAALSPQECVIETKCRLEPGTAVEVWLRTEGMPLRLAAKLVDRQDGGVKFAFQPMPSRKQEQLEVLRAELGLA